MASAKTWARELRVVLEFIAGFAATILFHQPALWLLKIAGLTTRSPYPMTPVAPFQVPAVVSLAFWGGLWGIVMLHLLSRIRSDAAYAAAAALFGAVLPTAVAWFVVAPLKGQPASIGIVGPVVNAAWGLGTAILFRFFSGANGVKASAA